MPADIRPGSKISGSIGPPRPAASMRIIAPMTGRAEDRGDRGERRGCGEHCHDLVGRILLDQPHGEDRQAAAEGDERGFWTQDEAESERGQRGKQDARQFDGLGGARLEPFVGDVTAVAGQADDRDGRQHAGDRHHRQRPPPRDGIKSQPAGQRPVHLFLDPVDQFQETPRGEGDRHTDQSGQDEQDPVALAPDRRAWIGRERAARLVVGAGFCGPGAASAAGGPAPPGVIVDLRRGLNLAVLHRALERVIARDPGGGAVAVSSWPLLRTALT